MEELKQEGDGALRDGRFDDAIRLYTKAIELKPIPDLFTNRSLAYLKLEKMYEAHCDAKEAIRMNPMWSKGYITFGEVRYAIGQYQEAVTSYQTAQLIHQQNNDGRIDPLLMFRLKQCHTHMLSQSRYDKNMPWVCAGVGLILAVVVIVADYTLAKQPALNHVAFQTMFLLVLSACGGLVGLLCVWYAGHLRSTRLCPPANADENGLPNPGGEHQAEIEAPAPAPKQHPRYTKAQARQRFRKGKGKVTLKMTTT